MVPAVRQPRQVIGRWQATQTLTSGVKETDSGIRFAQFNEDEPLDSVLCLISDGNKAGRLDRMLTHNSSLEMASRSCQKFSYYFQEIALHSASQSTFPLIVLNSEECSSAKSW